VRNRFREKFAERDVYDEEKLHPRAWPVLRNFGASPATFPLPSSARSSGGTVIIGDQGKDGKVSSISTAVKETEEVPLEGTRSMDIPCFGYRIHRERWWMLDFCKADRLNAALTSCVTWDIPNVTRSEVIILNLKFERRLTTRE